MKKHKYTLELTEEQAQVHCEALEMYSRVQTGQFWAMAEPWFLEENHRALYDALDSLKSIIFPELQHNAYLGIHSPKVSDKAKMAWDVQQVIRHRLIWDKHPEGGMGVSFHTPHRAGPAPLAKIKVGGERGRGKYCPCNDVQCPESQAER